MMVLTKEYVLHIIEQFLIDFFVKQTEKKSKLTLHYQTNFANKCKKLQPPNNTV